MQNKPWKGDPLLALHTFSLGGHSYAVEGSSGTALELDAEVGRALAALHESVGDTDHRARYSAYSSASPRLRVKLKRLRDTVLRYVEGGTRLRWAGAQTMPPSEVELCLCATFRCNLACKYCFVRLSGRDRSDPRYDMTFETAKAAIEFALERLTAPPGKLIVSFGHTGEPLLVRGLHEQVEEHVRFRSAETGRRMAYIMASTNLTLAQPDGPPRLSWPTMSLDGPRRIHDRFRTDPSGRGTYDLVVPALRKFLITFPAEAAETNLAATITGCSTDIKGIFLHLASFGVPFITLYPVRLPPESALSITEGAARELLAGYDDLVQYLLALDDVPLVRYLRCMMHPQDYFGRHVLRIASKRRVRQRCDAGVGMYAVTPDGNVFPCPELAALGRMRVGSIWNGLDEAVLTQLRSRSVWDLSTCAACWARLLCGGDCLSNRAMYEPFGTPPDPGMCAFTRGLIERAVHLVARLRAEHATVYSAVLESEAHGPVAPPPAMPNDSDAAATDSEKS